MVRGGGPCIVCGDSSGNCTGHFENGDSRITFVDKTENQNETFYVSENVYSEVNITPKRKTKVLAAAKGSWITETKARELGLLE